MGAGEGVRWRARRSSDCSARARGHETLAFGGLFGRYSGTPMPGWRNGRRFGLKIRFPQGSVGSSPAPGTNLNPMPTVWLFRFVTKALHKLPFEKVVDEAPLLGEHALDDPALEAAEQYSVS